MAQVIAGVVLAQAREAVPDAPVGQHHLDPQTEVAGIAVAQHIDAARVGGKVSADPRRALGGDAEGEQPVHRRRRIVDVRQDRARLDHHHVFLGVNRADRGHPFQRQKQRRGTVGHDLPAHQPGAAAIGQHTDPRSIAGTQDCGHLCGGLGCHDQSGMTGPATARLLQIGGRHLAEGAVGQMVAQRAGEVGCGGVQCHVPGSITPPAVVQRD